VLETARRRYHHHIVLHPRRLKTCSVIYCPRHLHRSIHINSRWMALVYSKTTIILMSCSGSIPGLLTIYYTILLAYVRQSYPHSSTVPSLQGITAAFHNRRARD